VRAFLHGYEAIREGAMAALELAAGVTELIATLSWPSTSHSIWHEEKCFPITIVAAACLALSFQASAEPIDPTDVRVIDGDTVQVYGVEPNVRLVGFDTPETWRPDCEAERVLGLKATERLKALVRAGKLDFQYVRCSCPESKIGTHWCNWGRDCAR
jgi:endonuclease YncB( thermonuclease family)